MRWRRLIQIRLSTLVWLTVVVGAALGGYRAGINEQLARQRQGKTYFKSYSVKDLVYGPGMTKPDFDSLIDMLVSLSPKKWAANGGGGNVAGYDNAGIIVVEQDAATHRQIQRKLAALRRVQSPRRSWLNYFVVWLNEDEPT